MEIILYLSMPQRKSYAAMLNLICEALCIVDRGRVNGRHGLHVVKRSVHQKQHQALRTA